MSEPLQSITRHNIALEGLTPYLAIPLALVLAWAIWRLYVKELTRLPSGPRRWISVLRCVAVIVVVLAFTNPTWEIIRAQVQKPLVAIAIDTSRSMELPDDQMRPEELVRRAVALGVLDRERRSTAAMELAQMLRGGHRDLRRAESALKRGASRARHAPNEKRTLDEVKASVRSAEETRAAVLKKLQDVIGLATEVENALADAPDLLRRAEDAHLNSARLAKVVLEGFLPMFYEKAKAFEATRVDIYEMEEAMLETGDTATICRELADIYDRLQDESDARLLATADPSTQEKIRALGKLPRREVIQRMLGGSGGIMASLRETYRVRLYRVDDRMDVLGVDDPENPIWEADGAGTDWGGGLEGLGESIAHENLAGVLAISDGRHTEGPPPQENARAVAALGVPLHTAGIGSTVEPLDVALVNIQAPQTMFKEEELRVRAFVRVRGFPGVELKAGLFEGEKQLGEASAKVPKAVDGGLVTLRFEPQQVELGRHRLEVRLQPVSGESIAENNRLAFHVSVIDRRLKALFAEGMPRWQQMELTAALRRDPNVSLREVVLGTQPERKKEVNQKYEVVLGKSRRLQRGEETGTYPLGREELFEYDVVFLGDFPILDLTFEEQRALSDFVRYKGGSLVLCAGHRENPYVYEDSALGELLPVVLPLQETDDEHLAFRPYFQDGYGLQLTPAGRGSPLCRLVPDQQRNMTAWKDLPRSYWRFPGLTARPHATVLAQTADENKEPVIVSRQVGLGRVLYVGLDDVWRWKASDDTFAASFWRKVLRWAVAGGNSVRSKHIGLATNKRRYGVGEEVVLGVQVTDDDNYGIENDILKASAFATPSEGEAPTDSLKEVRLEALPGSPGLYRGVLAGLPEGRYTVRITSAFYKEESAGLSGVSFTVGRDPFLEHQDVTLNKGLLEEIAQEGGGEYFSVDRLAGLAKHLPKGETRETSRRSSRPLWDNWYYLAILLSLFTIEWVIRKVNGLL